MSDRFEPDQLEVGVDPRIGNWYCQYKGIEIPMWTQGVVGGRGAFYNIDDEFFVKAAYAYRDGDSQCKTEAYMYGKIQDEDKRYFPEMLGCCNFESNIHWTCWRYIPGLTKTFSDDPRYPYCEVIVNTLCDKYDIGDVRTYPNGNWWIVGNDPIIVDLGIEWKRDT